MKVTETTNIALLKSKLSFYLKLVKKGGTVIVKDRNEPIAEIIPIGQKPESRWESLVREGKIVPAIGSLVGFRSPLARHVPIQDILQKMRED